MDTNNKPQRTNKPKRVFTLPSKAIDYSKPTPEQLTAFNNTIELISKGLAMTKACDKLQQITSHTFTHLVAANDNLKSIYARACEEREVVLFDRALEVATDNTNDFYVNDKGCLVPNPVAVQRSRVIMDTVFKALAIMNHKKYGNRLNVDANVNVTNPLTPDEAAKILNELE